MTRLETIRSYFIEQFFSTITNDPAFVGLQFPAELFDAQGHFNVPSDASGFMRIPTFANLEQRIAAAPAGKEKSDLTKFLAIVRRAFNQITGGLDNLSFTTGRELAQKYAPIVRHPDDQSFFPASPDTLLNLQDSVLQAHFYSSSGQSALSGQIYQQMFENPEVAGVTGLPTEPYRSKRPFVATVGIEPAPGFPATPLSEGTLNLSGADARLNPGRLQPTLFAEIKRLPGALVLNELYQNAASMPGRFATLRNNRIHLDPLLKRALSQARTAMKTLHDTAMEQPGLRAVPPAEGPFMVVFHGYYPVDDEERRRPSVGATNREFHHLAMGLMLSNSERQVTKRREHETRYDNIIVFTCEGPDQIRMMPLDHPFIEKRNDNGEPAENGSHVVLFSVLGSPSSWRYDDQPSDGNKNIIQDSVSKDASWGNRILGGLTFVAFGAGIGAVGGPIGALIGAAIALIVYVLISIFCFLFGCGENDNKQFQQSPAFDPPSTGNSFTLSASNDIAPPGVSQPTGGATPARTFDLRLIPHFFDKNLYGLLGGGNGTMTISNDAEDKEMLGWHAFPAGIGYQFDRTVPGAIDISGSSLRNYFDLFVKKYLDVQEAKQAVTYF